MAVFDELYAAVLVEGDSVWRKPVAQVVIVAVATGNHHRELVQRGILRMRDLAPILHDCLGFGSHTAQQRRQAHTKYFLCDVLIHSLCVLESVYQINRGLCGAEVMMSLVFGDFFTTGGARIAVVAGVNVSDTDFRFQIPVSS